jgi:hypothetical protein
MIEEPNPALAPIPEEPVEKTYKVVGGSTVFGHETGETFTATLSFQQEASLTEYGHLEVVEEAAPVVPVSPAPVAPEPASELAPEPEPEEVKE